MTQHQRQPSDGRGATDDASRAAGAADRNAGLIDECDGRGPCSVPIAWLSGGLVSEGGRWSKCHLLADERDERTLCGLLIPDDATDVDDGAACGDGRCKRCARISEGARA